MRRIRDFMPATLSLGQRQIETIVAATSKDVAFLLPRDEREQLPRLPRPALISFNHQGHLIVLSGTAEQAAQGCVAFEAAREGRVDNLRSSPRLDLQLPVRVAAAGAGTAPHATTTVNVSSGGVLMTGTGYVARGAEVHVALDLPGDAGTVEADGRVVRVDARGTSVRFADLDREQRDLLESLVLSVRAQLARRFAAVD